MTPTRLQACLNALRWSQRDLASELAIDKQQVTRMLAGTARVPPEVAAWLERLVSFHRRHQAPEWGQQRESRP